MPPKKGSTLGATLLIGASCIGAGMLGLPIQTGITGYVPSLLMFIIIWAFMTFTGLLIAEAGSWHKVGANLLTLTHYTLGNKGKIACWIFYLFLLYALLVAFISASGHLLSVILNHNFGIIIPSYLGSIFFVCVFGYIVYLGARPVDLCNRLLMFVKIGAFLVLLLLGVKFIHPVHYAYSNLVKVPSALPILITAFGYQNIVPILNKYLDGDVKRVKRSIVSGSLLSLIIYLAWQTVVLGIIPMTGTNSIEESLRTGKEATEVMGTIMNTSKVGSLAEIFGFFAILTSFLAQALSLSHFLSEGFKIQYKNHENIAMCALTLLPPLGFALLFPDIFFKALNFAGGFCVVILFGILPTLMIWKGRYTQKHLTQHKVFGGKTMLTLVFLFSAYIFLFEISSMFSFI